MGILAKATELYYSFFEEDIKEYRGMKPRFSKFELAAAKKVAKTLAIPVNQLEFCEAEPYFEDVADQLKKDFKKGLTIKIQGDDDLFFYGIRNNGKAGLWPIGYCPVCNAMTITGGEIENLFQLGKPGKYPWWHKSGCKVVTPSMPCH